MPDPDFVALFRDFGDLVLTSRALRIADEATKEAIDQAVLEAGRAVGQTITRDDPELALSARKSITECRNLIELLRVEVARSRAILIESTSLRQDASDLQRAQSTQNEMDPGRKK